MIVSLVGMKGDGKGMLDVRNIDKKRMTKRPKEL